MKNKKGKKPRQQCGNCRFAKNSFSAYSVHCHRFPVTLEKQKKDTCGEFQPNESALPEAGRNPTPTP